MHRDVLAGAIRGLLLLPTPARAEWTFAAYLGGASTGANTPTLDQPALGTASTCSPSPDDSRSLEPPLYCSYRIGRFWNGRLGIEAEFIHLKV